MAYIGIQPELGRQVLAQSFSGNGSQLSFTLNQTVSATKDIEVLVDNVQQSPYDGSYSVSGTTLTFSEAPSSGTNNIYVIYRAATISTLQVIPDNGSVTTVKLSDDAITPEKISNNNLSWDANGNILWNRNSWDYSGNNGLQIRALSTNNASIFLENSSASVKSLLACDNASSALRVGTITNHPVLITSGDTTRMRIDSDKVTIQNTGTDTALQIDAGGDLRIYAVNGTTFADIWCDPNPTGIAGNDIGGGLMFTHGIFLQSQRTSYDRSWNDEPSITVLNDTTNGSQATFRVHGSGGISGGDFSVNFVVDGSISSSDRRKKTNIVPITNALEKVKQLQGVAYSLINSDLEIQAHMSDAPNGRKFGFIAQDTQIVTPELTKQFEGSVAIPKENGWCDGFGLDYSGAVPLLNEAIKEQQIIIEQLIQRIEALENN